MTNQHERLLKKADYHLKWAKWWLGDGHIRNSLFNLGAAIEVLRKL